MRLVYYALIAIGLWLLVSCLINVGGTSQVNVL